MRVYAKVPALCNFEFCNAGLGNHSVVSSLLVNQAVQEDRR